METFRKWIECQPLEDITLDDYGTKFEVDHLAALSSFNPLKGMHWSNIRPCTGVANSEKKDSTDHHLMALQELKAMFFFTYLSN